MTPLEVLRLSEPVEKMYADCVSELIVNIAAHFKSGRDLETQEWQIKKLSELGQLTQESVEIIARHTGEAPEAIRAACEKSAGMTLENVEKTLCSNYCNIAPFLCSIVIMSWNIKNSTII